MTTIEATIVDLCDQVDYWKARAEKYKELYEQANKDYNQQMSERLEEGHRMIGNLLTFALHSKDDGETITLDREGRNAMLESLKSRP